MLKLSDLSISSIDCAVALSSSNQQYAHANWLSRNLRDAKHCPATQLIMFEFYTAERTSFCARLSRGSFAHAVGDKVEAGRWPAYSGVAPRMLRTLIWPLAFAAKFARCFLRLANLPNFALDRLSRYEATLWRQAPDPVA